MAVEPSINSALSTQSFSQPSNGAQGTYFPVIENISGIERGMVTSKAQAYTPPAAVEISPFNLLTNNLKDYVTDSWVGRAFNAMRSHLISPAIDSKSPTTEQEEALEPNSQENLAQDSLAPEQKTITDAELTFAETEKISSPHEVKTADRSALNSLACVGIAHPNPVVKVTSAALCFAGEIETAPIDLPVALTNFRQFLRYANKPTCDKVWIVTQFLTLADEGKKKQIAAILQKNPDMVPLYCESQVFLSLEKSVQNQQLLLLNQAINPDFEQGDLSFVFFRNKYDLGESSAAEFLQNLFMLKDLDSIELAKSYIKESALFLTNFKQELTTMDPIQSIVLVQALKVFQHGVQTLDFFESKTPEEIIDIIFWLFNFPNLTENLVFLDVLLTHPTLVNGYFASEFFNQQSQQIKDAHISKFNTMHVRDSFVAAMDRFNRDNKVHEVSAIVSFVESLLNLFAPTSREQAALYLMSHQDLLSVYKGSAYFINSSSDQQRKKINDLHNLMSTVSLNDIATSEELEQLSPHTIEKLLTLFSEKSVTSAGTNFLVFEENEIKINSHYLILHQVSALLHRNIDALRAYVRSDRYQHLDNLTQEIRKEAIEKIVKQLNRQLFRSGVIGVPLSLIFENNIYMETIKDKIAENNQSRAEITSLKQQILDLKQANDPAEPSKIEIIKGHEKTLSLKEEILNRSIYGIFAKVPGVQEFLKHLASEGKKITLNEVLMLIKFIEAVAKSPSLFQEAGFDDNTIDEAVELHGLMSLLEPLLYHKYELRSRGFLTEYDVRLAEDDYDALTLGAFVQTETQKLREKAGGLQTCGLEEFIPMPPTDALISIYGAVVRFMRAGGFSKIMAQAFRYNFFQEGKAKISQDPNAQFDFMLYVLQRMHSDISSSLKTYSVFGDLATLAKDGSGEMLLMKFVYEDLIAERQMSSLSAEKIQALFLAQNIYTNLVGMMPFSSTVGEVLQSVEKFEQKMTTGEKVCAVLRPIAAVAGDVTDLALGKKVKEEITHLIKNKFLKRASIDTTTLSKTDIEIRASLKQEFIKAGFSATHLDTVLNLTKDYTIVNNEMMLRAVLAETCDVTLEKKAVLAKLSLSEYQRIVSDLRFFYGEIFAKTWRSIADQALLIKRQLLDTNVNPSPLTLYTLERFVRKADEIGLGIPKIKVLMAELLNMEQRDKDKFTGLTKDKFNFQLVEIAENYPHIIEHGMLRTGVFSTELSSDYLTLRARGLWVEDSDTVSFLTRYYKDHSPDSAFNSPLQILDITHFFGELSDPLLQKIESLGSSSAITTFMQKILKRFAPLMHSAMQFRTLLNQKISAVLNIKGEFGFLHRDIFNDAQTLYLSSHLDLSALHVEKHIVTAHCIAIKVNSANKAKIAAWLGKQEGVRAIGTHHLRELSSDSLTAVNYEDLPNLRVSIQNRAMIVTASGDKYVTYTQYGMLDGKTLAEKLYLSNREIFDNTDFVDFKSAFSGFGGMSSPAQVLANVMRVPVIGYPSELSSTPVIYYPARFDSKMADLSESINAELSIKSQQNIAKHRREFKGKTNTETEKRYKPFGSRSVLSFLQAELKELAKAYIQAKKDLDIAETILDEAVIAGKVAAEIQALTQKRDQKQEKVTQAKQNYQTLLNQNKKLIKKINEEPNIDIDPSEKKELQQRIDEHIRCKRADDRCVVGSSLDAEPLVNLEHPPAAEEFWQAFEPMLTEKEFRQIFIRILVETNLEADLTLLEQSSNDSSNTKQEKARLVGVAHFRKSLLQRAKSIISHAVDIAVQNEKLAHTTKQAGDVRKELIRHQAGMLKELSEAYQTDFLNFQKQKTGAPWQLLNDDELTRTLKNARTTYGRVKEKAEAPLASLTKLEENKEVINRAFFEVLGTYFFPPDNAGVNLLPADIQTRLYQIVTASLFNLNYEIAHFDSYAEKVKKLPQPERFYHLKLIHATNKLLDSWYDLKAKVIDFVIKNNRNKQVETAQSTTNKYDALQAVSNALKTFGSRALSLKQLETIISTNKDDKFIPLPDIASEEVMKKWCLSAKTTIKNSEKQVKNTQNRYEKSFQSAGIPEIELTQALQKYLDMSGKNVLASIVSDPIFENIDVDTLLEPMLHPDVLPQQPPPPQASGSEQQQNIVPPAVPVRTQNVDDAKSVADVQGMDVLRKLMMKIDITEHFFITEEKVKAANNVYPLKYHLVKFAHSERWLKRIGYKLKTLIIKLMQSREEDTTVTMTDPDYFALNEQLALYIQHATDYTKTAEVFLNARENTEPTGLTAKETKQFINKLKLPRLENLTNQAKEEYLAAKDESQYSDNQVLSELMDYIQSPKSIKSALKAFADHPDLLKTIYQAIEREIENSGDDPHAHVAREYLPMVKLSSDIYTGDHQDALFIQLLNDFERHAERTEIRITIPDNLLATSVRPNIVFPLNLRGKILFTQVMEKIGNPDQLLVTKALIESAGGEYPIKFYLTRLAELERKIKKEHLNLKYATAVRIGLLSSPGNEELKVAANKDVTLCVEKLVLLVKEYSNHLAVFAEGKEHQPPKNMYLGTIIKNTLKINLDKIEKTIIKAEKRYRQQLAKQGLSDAEVEEILITFTQLKGESDVFAVLARYETLLQAYEPNATQQINVEAAQAAPLQDVRSQQPASNALQLSATYQLNQQGLKTLSKIYDHLAGIGENILVDQDVLTVFERNFPEVYHLSELAIAERKLKAEIVSLKLVLAEKLKLISLIQNRDQTANTMWIFIQKVLHEKMQAVAQAAIFYVRARGIFQEQKNNQMPVGKTLESLKTEVARVDLSYLDNRLRELEIEYSQRLTALGFDDALIQVRLNEYAKSAPGAKILLNLLARDEFGFTSDINALSADQASAPVNAQAQARSREFAEQMQGATEEDIIALIVAEVERLTQEMDDNPSDIYDIVTRPVDNAQAGAAVVNPLAPLNPNDEEIAGPSGLGRPLPIPNSQAGKRPNQDPVGAGGKQQRVEIPNTDQSDIGVRSIDTELDELFNILGEEDDDNARLYLDLTTNDVIYDLFDVGDAANNDAREQVNHQQPRFRRDTGSQDNNKSQKASLNF